MTILEEIVGNKRRELEISKAACPPSVLTASRYYERAGRSLKAALITGGGPRVIAEIKRKSPSKGVINAGADAGEIAAGYETAGAAAVSVLTDGKYFGGCKEDLIAARSRIDCPILRKDFVVDEYQIIEAKAWGADAVLLIAAILSADEVRRLSRFAKKLGLEVLLEVHTRLEMERSIAETVDLVGVNNRDLHDFSVDVGRSELLAPLIAPIFTLVAESGLGDSRTIHRLHLSGFRGFLVGEAFMRDAEPAKACARLIRELRN